MSMRDSRPTARERIHRIQNGKDFRLDHAVIHVPAVPTVSQDPGLPQNHEMLGDVGLAQLEHGLHVANTLLAVTQNLQNMEANRMRETLEHIGGGAVGIVHIQTFEYDYRQPEASSSVMAITDAG
jgi:hypothetical protein